MSQYLHKTHSTPLARVYFLGAASEGDVTRSLCASLRGLALAGLTQHQHETAAFYGDKLATLSAEPTDALLLADCFYRGGEYARAFRVLESRGLLDPARHKHRPSHGTGGEDDSAAGARSGSAGRRGSLGPPPSEPKEPSGRGIVPVDALRYFYLGALCLRGLKAWEK
jgi:hypothetical protein